jgi:acyl carrier protein
MFEQIKAILVDELGLAPADITPNATMSDNLGITSLEFLNAVMVIEDQYDITTDEETLKTLTTVDDFVKYIESLVAAK